MKIRTLAAACAALLSAGAFAADAPAGSAIVPVRQLVPYLEHRYEGQVIAVALDAGADKPAHYHVDLFYPSAGTAKLDVDAATLEIAARIAPTKEDGWASLPGATAFAATHVRGEVIAAEFDADGISPHYDVDIRLSGGDIARVTVDPRTRHIGWRTPPVLSN